MRRLRTKIYSVRFKKKKNCTFISTTKMHTCVWEWTAAKHIRDILLFLNRNYRVQHHRRTDIFSLWLRIRIAPKTFVRITIHTTTRFDRPDDNQVNNVIERACAYTCHLTKIRSPPPPDRIGGERALSARFRRLFQIFNTFFIYHRSRFWNVFML